MQQPSILGRARRRQVVGDHDERWARQHHVTAESLKRTAIRSGGIATGIAEMRAALERDKRAVRAALAHHLTAPVNQDAVVRRRLAGVLGVEGRAIRGVIGACGHGQGASSLENDECVLVGVPMADCAVGRRFEEHHQVALGPGQIGVHGRPTHAEERRVRRQIDRRPGRDVVREKNPGQGRNRRGPAALVAQQLDPAACGRVAIAQGMELEQRADPRGASGHAVLLTVAPGRNFAERRQVIDEETADGAVERAAPQIEVGRLAQSFERGEIDRVVGEPV